MKFYKLNTFELQQELATDLKSGLSQSQAEERLKKDGPNFRMSNSVCHTKIPSFTLTAFYFACSGSVFSDRNF